MTEFQSKIDTYALNLNTPNSSVGKVIHLRGSFGMAFIHLMPEGEELPANRKKEGVNQFYIFLRSNDWGPLVDMLRYESPVNFFYSDETKVAGIFTDREVVGEGDE